MKKYEYEVIEADDGEEAIRICGREARKIDLLLTAGEEHPESSG